MAARVEIQFPEVVTLQSLDTSALDPLFHEEIGIWDRRFNWDFRPSAELLRRFVQIHSLYGYALMAGREVVGYSYYVCEGRKGLIGDFFLRGGHGTSANEMTLLGATVQGMMLTSGIRRIESQLMLLYTPTTHPLPFKNYLKRHDRRFMDIGQEAIGRLTPQIPEVNVRFFQWEERFQEDIAHLVSAAYRGHVDSEINDQYRTIPGARSFLTNIVKFPGCGMFSPAGSTVAIDERSGRVCGVCLASLVSPMSGHVTQICVLPAIRGARLGYELLRHTLTRLVNTGCTSVSLTVTSSNMDAIRLYEAVGFRSRSDFPALVWEGF